MSQRSGSLGSFWLWRVGLESPTYMASSALCLFFHYYLKRNLQRTDFCSSATRTLQAASGTKAIHSTGGENVHWEIQAFADDEIVERFKGGFVKRFMDNCHCIVGPYTRLIAKMFRLRILTSSLYGFPISFRLLLRMNCVIRCEFGGLLTSHDMLVPIPRGRSWQFWRVSMQPVYGCSAVTTGKPNHLLRRGKSS